MLQKLILSLVLLYSFLLSFSQKEAQIWYFGQNAGLDFSTKPPTLLTNGQINTREGVSSICDKNGQLLFYSEGTKVWDRTHAVMPNGSGLQGDYSSTQSSIAIPNPSNPQRYYLFTTAYLLGTLYSEVDMSLNGGKGDVIPLTKNTALIPNSQSSEKLIATRHCNRVDYWVITHKVNSSEFSVYLVNSAGVQPPVTFNIGSTIGSSSYWQGTGYLKLSPDGSRLVNVMGNSNASNIDGKAEIFNFDNKTGVISGPVINLPGFNQSYGAEFSSDNRYLYITSLGDKSLFQYDLTAPNVINSKFVVANNFLSYGALQMGIDGKIYVASENGYNNGYGYLGVINNPGMGGLACNYVMDGISLGARKTLIGLPTYLSNFLKDTSGIAIQNNCAQKASIFSTIYTGNIDSVSWDFGDGSAVVKQLNPQHVYTVGGNYNVRTIIYRSCNANDTLNKQVNIRAGYATTTNLPVCAGAAFTLPNGTIVNTAGDYPVSYVSTDGCDSIVTFRVSFLPPPAVSLGNDTTLCVNPAYTLDAGAGFNAYTWQDGSSAQNFSVNATGVYWVEVTAANGCKKRDTIIVSKSTLTSFSLGPDKTICGSNALSIGQNVSGSASYLWNTGAVTSQINAVSAGEYWVEIQENGCVKRDTIALLADVSPSLNLGNDTMLCNSQSYTLIANAGFSAYTWQDGSTNQNFLVNAGGLYWAEVVSSNGCRKRDSITVTKSTLTGFSLGPDKTICTNSTLLIGQNVPGSTSYLWNTGDVSSQINAGTAGLYWVEVQEGGCIKRDTVTLLADASPSLNLGNDTTLCNSQSFSLSASAGFNAYTWQDGSTGQSFLANASGLYWAEGLSANGCKKRDSIVVTKSLLTGFSLGPDKTICGTNSITIGQNIPGVSYSWNTGASASQINVSNAGNYWLEVKDNSCTRRDTINLVAGLPAAVKAQKSNDINCGAPLAQLTATGADRYEWTPSAGLSNATIANPQVAINSTTTFVVKGITNDGCVGYDSVKIAVVSSPGKESYAMPTAFTPNSDGKNDCFGVRKWGALQSLEMTVYNRWGQVVFSSKDISACWDGTIGGKKQDPGGYVYIIRAKSFCGEIFRKGMVMLVR